MSTQVSALYEYARDKYSLTLRGGQGGLTNSTYWVYLAEDIQNMSFLKGGELVVSTGLFTQSGVGLHEFIRALVMRNCSGILINTGKYLLDTDITAEIMEFCTASNFPIFTMPWEVHLIDIMQDCCALLMRRNQNDDQLNAMLQSAFYQYPAQDHVLRTLNQLGYPTAADYRIIAIKNPQNTNRITLPLNASHLKFHLFEHDNMQILIYDSAQRQPSLAEIMDTICFCDGVKLGVSDEIHSLAEISPCYKRACFSLAAAVFWDRRSVVFEDLGLFQVLFSTSDPGLLERIYTRSLGKLEQHDAEHDSEYMETLRTYLLSDCNILETAARMHTHRNTIVYRVGKIKEFLNTSLNDSAVKFDLLMAFYIKEYFSI